jgi:PAS domain S-box-containing protein
MPFARTDRDGVAPSPIDPAGEKTSRRAHILVVDLDEAARGALVKRLRADGYATSTAPDGENALAEARREPADVVLTDLQMPGPGGVELCQRFHQIDPDLPVIVMTAFSDMPSAIESLRAGAVDYLIKPLQYEVVVWCIERAIARRPATLEQQELSRTLNERLMLSSIREQEHAEAEAQQRAQLTALLENLQDGVFIADQSGRVLIVNDAARAIMNVSDEDLRTADALRSLETHDLEGRPLSSDQRPLMRALRGEQFVEYETLRIRSSGERRRIVSTGTSVRDENGNLELAIVVFRDVTELRRLERQRDEYLALISHDLRSPLGSMSIFVSMLKESMEKKGLIEDVTLAERAERSVVRINTMLQELAEATSLEANGIALHRGPCDLRELIAGTVDRMDNASARRVTIETDDASPYIALADASLLERVVDNLLTNALKYSAEDAHVTARLARRGSDVELDVIDRGIGIAPESVKTLFDRYYRTTEGKARASGLGLGLYIARLIVEAHGGRIDVSSKVGEVGKGSTFRLILPSHAAPA